jgi:hypothetical protein
MAYRDQPVDPRIVELTSLIASEPDLQKEAASIKREEYASTETADRIGPELAEAERELEQRRAGGVIATVSGWFGRSLEEHEREVARLQTEHAEVTTRIAALSAAATEIRSKLTAINEARVELERLHDNGVAALRTAEGPHGDEVRALDADDAREREPLLAINRVIDVCDLARHAVWTIDAVVADLETVKGAAQTVVAVLQRLESPLETPAIVEDRDATRTRLSDAIGFASTQLRELVAAHDALEMPWPVKMPRARVLQLAASQIAGSPENSESVKNSGPLAEFVTELLAVLVAKRDQLVSNRAEREKRRRELAGTVRS